MSDTIKYNDIVYTGRKVEVVEVSLDELWENWKDQDQSIIKPLIELCRAKQAKIEQLEKELAGWVISHSYTVDCDHDWETWNNTGGETRRCKKCGMQESWTFTIGETK